MFVKHTRCYVSISITKMKKPEKIPNLRKLFFKTNQL